MSDTSTSSEVSKKLYENYGGEVVTPVFYALDINLKGLKKEEGSPNASTSGVVEVTPREAGKINSADLLVGFVAMPLVPRTPEMDEMISKRAKASGGVGKNEGGVVTLKQRGIQRNGGMELGN